MDRPALLVLDLRRYEQDASLYDRLGQTYRVYRVRDEQHAEELLRRVRPFALCIDYDYPDIGALLGLKHLRRRHASIPVVMLTEQHSEALAVWALRARVWDYMVKPVPLAVLAECLLRLETLPRRETPRALVHPPHNLPAETRLAGAQGERRALNAALNYIDGHLHQPIREKTVADACGMSRFQFSRCFRRAHGKTFQQFLLERRITEAARLLKHPSASVVDVCCTVGFSDASYFARIFRRFTGMSPSEYRRAWKAGHDTGPYAPPAE